MVAQKTRLVNSHLTVHHCPDQGVVLLENDNRLMGFGVEMQLADAIAFAQMVLMLAGEANKRLPTDAEMAMMDADYRELADIGMDIDF